MFNVREAPTAIRIELASEPDHIERVIREAGFFLEKRGCDSCLAFNIVVRELLRNAIEHGNLSIAGRRIFFTLEMAAASFCRFTVEDEGEGFAHARLGPPAEDPRRGRRRGLVLIRELVEQLEFNERGNRVSVMLRLDGGDSVNGRQDPPRDQDF